MSRLELLGVLSIAITLAFTWWAARQKAHEGGQTVLDSVKEAWTNIGIGFAINYVANLTVLPQASCDIGFESAFWVGCVFTAISIIRQFIVRRRYNRKTVRHA